MFNRGRNQQEDKTGEINLAIFRVQLESLRTLERVLNDPGRRHVHEGEFHVPRCKTDTMVSTMCLAASNFTTQEMMFICDIRGWKEGRAGSFDH